MFGTKGWCSRSQAFALARLFKSKSSVIQASVTFSFWSTNFEVWPRVVKFRLTLLQPTAISGGSATSRWAAESVNLFSVVGAAHPMAQ